MSFELVELSGVGVILIWIAITVALIRRRFAGQTPHSEDHPDRKRIFDFWIAICVSCLVAISVSEYLVILSMTTGCHYPIEATVRTELNQLKLAIADCRMATGSAPTNVSELKMLFGTYYEPDEMLKQGKDRWGNPLVILPVPGKPEQFTLRSTGPDGKLQIGPQGDDIVVTYTAESRSTKHKEPNTKNN